MQPIRSQVVQTLPSMHQSWAWINTNINLEFSSGAALSGEYTVSQVLNENSFLVIYPFSQTTSGYVKVTNLKPHGMWIHGYVSRMINLLELV